VAKETNNSKQAILKSSGNVFVDLGLKSAQERQTKVRLAVTLNQIIQDHRLSQMAAAKALGINQPKISALLNYKLDGFSVERLMQFLNALDQDIEIVVRKKPRSRRAARIVVVALLEEVSKTKKPIRITRHGKPVAEVVSPSPARKGRKFLGTAADSFDILDNNIVGPIIDFKEMAGRRD
jgi:prevent-host-death family protein